MPVNSASGASCTINLLRPSPPSSVQPPTQVPCHEYKHETSIDPTTGAVRETVTIESQQACPFEIVLDIKPTAYASICPTSNQTDSTAANDSQLPIPSDYIVNTTLDGIPVSAYLQSKSARNFPVNLHSVLSHDRKTFKSYQFAKINLVDPDDYQDVKNPADKICEEEKVIKSLGTIQLDVFKCTLGERPIGSAGGLHTSTTNQMKFSERSKKARLSTTAGLSEQTASRLPPPLTVPYVITQDPHPFLQFFFKYKPRVILEAEGTITRPVVEVEVDSESENKCKAKNQNNKRVKTEAEDQKAPKKKSKIIDLTGSDESD
ncbi:hypothetical protein PTTG_27838 [Puccinia triticina 1-1 BBBD Race 1]|uniref:DUF7918 domain-containing protein n=2 Tax=Puccinia triticina TaxID=208348 RepID=A0A180GGL5_PUCT1|nr:uncharacterized protein PtA15_1A120 [Puccinia triticina]OAV91886.1 hypothetical protein PTTG_27838 [Puccinia triticina 1-1 BBBD Race 1]WAQ80782.1 hypothetical protein PtA15_1A120 [Puccinia triticina]WAR51675.1 hypothetical protein PtB15_1B111 [Puccinia triticina]